MNNSELLEYLTDKSGEYNKRLDWKYLQKQNITVYNELKKLYTDILDNTKVSEIYYRLKNNINEIPKCPICGNPVKYTSNGYSTYCSKECWISDKGRILSSQKHKQTNIKKYGVENTQQLKSVEEKRLNSRNKHIDQIKEKFKQTCIERYGVENPLSSHVIYEKGKNTLMHKYNTDNVLKNNEIREKIKQTWINKYGVDHPMKNKEFWKKSQLKRSQSSISKYEIKFFEYLKQKFNENDVIHQYSSDLYPFHCDFYIKSLNLYIELQGHWTHGPHQYNENNKNDSILLDSWKEKAKNDKYYEHAIYTWTISDVNKRIIANNNKLNYLEIFGYSLSNSKQFLDDYISHFE